MTQQNPLSAFIAKNPSNALVPLLVDANGNLLVQLASVEPDTITPLSESSGNVANASAAATLPAVAGKTTYITGFTATAAGATAASVAELTVGGLGGGTQTFIFVFPAGVTVQATTLNVKFEPPLPASAADTAIVVTLPAGGSGNTNAAVVATGFQQ